MSDGEVVAEGRFRLDRRRALEKLEQFRFDDPRRYVLELLAAAVCAGAGEVELYNDSDDTVVSWRGRALSGDELDTLFDPLFGAPKDAWGRALQHLAIGTLGAHALAPTWLRIDTGDGATARRLEIRDPTETAHVALDEPVDGVRVHVREQFGAAVFLEAVQLAFRAPAETELLRGTLHWYPIPLKVNGRRHPTRPPPDPWVLRWSGEVDGQKAALWAVPRTGAVDLVRHGVVVGHVPMESVVGWIEADDLRLDASRARVVEDDAHKRLLQRLARARTRMEDEGLQALEPADHDEILWPGAEENASARRRERIGLWRTRGAMIARIGLRILAERPPGRLGPWENVACIYDVRDAFWSIAALRGESPCVSSVVADIPGWTRPTFAVEHQPLLLRAGLEAPDETATIEAHIEGARRRAQLAERRRPRRFTGEPHQGVFEGGAVRLLQTGPRVIRVQLQADGLPIEQIDVPSPAGPMQAILDEPAFATDPAFHRVLRDGVYKAAIERLTAAARAHAIERISAFIRHDDRTGALRLVSDALAAISETELDGAAPWAAFPVLTDGSGRHLSPADVVSRGAARPWQVVDHPVPDLAADQRDDVLVVPSWLIGMWRRWLGSGAVDGRDTVAAWRRRASLLARPKRQARLTRPVAFRHALTGQGWSGELGLLVPAGEAGIEVLREGVAVCEIAAPLPGVVGVVDVPDAPVTDAHDALTPDAERDLRQRLRREVDALMRAACAGSTAVPAVLRWLAAQRPDTLKGLDAVLGARVDGSPLRLSELGSRKKGEPKLTVVAEVPSVPGFEDAIVAGDDLRAVLDAFQPKGWRDVSGEVASVVAAWARFRQSPSFPVPDRVLASTRIEGEGWTARALLPADASTVGKLDVVALLDGRLLERDQREQPGAMLIVSGPAVQPSERWDRVEERRLMTRWRQVAAEALLTLVREATPSGLDRGRAEWRTLAARVLTTVQRQEPLAKAVAALPLLRVIDGRNLTADAVIEAARTGRVRTVRAGTPLVPGLEDLLIVDDPGTKALLTPLLRGDVRDATADLEAMREAAARKARLQRRKPTVEVPRLRVGRVDAAGARGEVALLPRGTGLSVTCLVDGLPLTEVQLPAPVPVAAVVEGPFRADPGFTRVVEDETYNAVLRAIRDQADALALAFLKENQRDSAWLGWSLQLALAGGPARDLAFIPRADGGVASLADLEREAATHGGIAVIDWSWGRVHPAPIVVTGAAREALRGRFRLVELQVGRRSAGGELAIQGGRVTASVGLGDGLQVWAGDFLIEEWDARKHGSPVPLDGWLDCEGLDAGPLGKGLVETRPGAQADADEAVAKAGNELLRRLVSRAATRPADAAVLLAHLRDLVPDAAAWKALGPHPLVEAPLFRHAQGGLRSLRDIVSGGRIDVVEPGLSADAIVVEPAERAWLDRVAKIRDVTARVREEAEGARRRAAARPPPAAPRHADVEALPGGGAVWLQSRGAQGPGGVDVVVGEPGRVVETREVPVPGLSGTVAGAFETDRRFSKATVPEPVWDEVLAAVGRLLAREWSRPGHVKFARLRGWLGDRSLRQAQLPKVWAGLPVTRTVAGAPVTLLDLRERRAKDVIAWAAPGEESDPNAILIDPGEYVAWAQLVEPARLAHAQALADEARARAAEREEAAAASARERSVERVVAAAQKLLPDDVGVPEIRAALRRFDVVDPDDLVGLHLAAAQVLHDAGRTADEVFVVERLLKRWAAR